MTAGKLKKILANIPDDTRLFIEEDMGIIRADVEPRLGIGRSGRVFMVADRIALWFEPVDAQVKDGEGVLIL
jgi:hypothetical protein